MDDRRTILEQVANGTLDPDEARARLAAIGAERRATTEPVGEPSWEDPPAWSDDTAWDDERDTWDDRVDAWEGRDEPADVDGARRLAVRVRGGSVSVIGDPDVAVVDVHGNHSLRREGDTLVVTSGPIWSGIEGAFAQVRRRGPFDLDVITDGAWRSVARDQFRGSSVKIRVNPDLPLDIQVTAGSAKVRQVRREIKVDVQAGEARLEDVEGPIEGRVSAGSLRARTRLRGGRSRIACDAGSVQLDLLEGSSTRLRVDSTLGSSHVLGAEPLLRADGDGDWIVGAGEGSLDIEANLSSVQVRVDPEDDQ